MKIATPDSPETRMTRLMTALLGDAGPLPRFIAEHRTPGAAWQSWDEIAFKLRDATQEPVSREGVIRWAKRYGIPLNTKRAATPQDITKYRAEIKRLGI